MTPKPIKPDLEPFLKNFERFEGPLQPSWLLPLRKAGISRFLELGFPTTQHEDWRFHESRAAHQAAAQAGERD
jgi:hypothetical protein